MEAPIEIRYAGVVVGRAQEVHASPGEDASSFFLPLREPMPVGSVVRLRSGDQETPARVLRAVEAPDPAGSGMQVRLIGDAELVAPEWIPPPPVATPAKAKPPAPEPIVDFGKDRSREIAPSVRSENPSENPSEDLSAAATVGKAEAEQAKAAQADVAPTDAKQVETSGATPETPTADATASAASAGVTTASASTTDVESTSREIAAVPEEVPIAVGSSMTGALESATETAPYGTAIRSQDDSAATRAVPEDSGSAPVSGEQRSVEEPPPARPVSSPTGRRRTKRRK
jgi:hypothetical protein